MSKIETNFEFNHLTFDEFANDAAYIIEQSKAVEEVKANHFPLNVFPSTFRLLIADCQKALNFPADYTGAAILSAVSTAIGKSAKLKVKNTWYEYPAFYMSLVGNPGAHKSHPIALVYKVFEELDRIEIKKAEKENSDYEEYQQLSKKEKEMRPKPPKPVLRKTILHNFTQEILHQRLTDNERSNTIVSEELATWLEGMNNYSKGDQSSLYLSLWSNKATSIDRVSKPIPLWLPQPFLNIIGSLQPKVLKRLFPTTKTDNGFLQRFLFAFPDNADKQPINDFEVNETLLQKYNSWITNFIAANPVLFDAETEKPQAKIYHWSKEAKAFFYQWQNENTAIVNENEESLKGEVFSKFDIHFARLSLVLQIMIDHTSNQISLQAAQGAEKLCTYFQKCAIKILQILENSNPLERLPQNKIDFYKALPSTFTTSKANALGETLEFNIKAVQRFLNDDSLFIRMAQGKYCKK